MADFCEHCDELSDSIKQNVPSWTTASFKNDSALFS
jgi:hypothetical protein